MNWGDLRDWLARTPNARLVGLKLNPDDCAALRGHGHVRVSEQLAGAVRCGIALGGPDIVFHPDPNIPHGEAVPVIRRRDVTPGYQDSVHLTFQPEPKH